MTDKNQNHDLKRIRTMAISVIFAVVFILVLHFTIPNETKPKATDDNGSSKKAENLKTKDARVEKSQIAVLLLDRGGLTYPFSIQNIMWIVFFIGMGELWLHFSAVRREHKHLRDDYLPEKGIKLPKDKGQGLLDTDDLEDIYKKVLRGADGLFLKKLIRRIIVQYRASATGGQAHAQLNSNMDLFLHDIDLRYNMLRYIMWLLPTIGFIGTVRGISDALAFAGSSNFNNPSLLSDLTTRLALAFNTTFLALVMAGILVFAMQIIQGSEERALNTAGQYCLDNLINWLATDDARLIAEMKERKKSK